MNATTSDITCCVVGGGPAGVMLGYLLARGGVHVTVLEKHKDFFRDFRGDTVHPSTLELFWQLGMLEDLLKLPHQELGGGGGMFGDFPFQAINLSRLRTHCRFVAVMPQWDFLNFLSDQAKRYSTFDLRMEHEAIELLWNDGRVCGVVTRTPQGRSEIRADLVVACDGRHSRMRAAASLRIIEVGVPIDVLWFRISRHETDLEQVFGRVNYGRAMVLINRGSYFQTALLIPKNGFEQVKEQGLQEFRDTIARISPFLQDRVAEIQDWEQIKLLSVQINRLAQWHRPGLLCIGDAAHAMSPVFGVGINLAIQDAVAAANLLVEPLKNGRSTDGLLPRVQRRREWPTRVTQRLQAAAHSGIQRVFRTQGPLRAPWQFRTVVSVPAVRYAMARVVGVGVRPEQVSTAFGARQSRPRLPKRAMLLGTLGALAGIALMIAGGRRMAARRNG
jgi:2-polyprenyl-6-methoxyphenol hydroxylase-like FAD-dependent oxidoreductase